MSRVAALILAMIVLLSAATSRASDVGDAARVAGLCIDAAQRAERLVAMPDGMITGIMLAETGRWNKALGRSYPWPWTVTSGTDYWFAESRADAAGIIRRLQSEGRSNIDVGCMQINLRWHPDAFASIEEALDPLRNVSYGAAFLGELFAERGSWSRAVAAYHSRDPERGDAYLARVEKLQEQQHFWSKDEIKTAFAEASSTWPLILRRRDVEAATVERALAKGRVLLSTLEAPQGILTRAAPGSVIRLRRDLQGGRITLKPSFLFSGTPITQMATVER